MFAYSSMESLGTNYWKRLSHYKAILNCSCLDLAHQAKFCEAPRWRAAQQGEDRNSLFIRCSSER
eukprot:2099392-Amphidinium_carterae.2